MINRQLFPILAVIIALLAGLAAWLLVDTWQSNQPVDIEDSERMSQQNALNTQLMQESLSEQVAGTLQNDQLERLESPLGQALFRKCSEWTEFSENQPGEAATRNQEKTCAEFQRYVEVGTIPE